MPAWELKGLVQRLNDAEAAAVEAAEAQAEPADANAKETAEGS